MKCPHCRKQIAPPHPSDVVYDTLEDLRWKNSVLYKLFLAPKFWDSFLTGAWLKDLSRTGHYFLFFAIWPALVFFALELCLLSLGEVLALVNRSIFNVLIAPPMRFIHRRVNLDG